MALCILKQKVTDFARWKSVFDAGEELRRINGFSVLSVSRDTTDPDTVIVITHVDSVEQGRTFLVNPALHAVMSKAGVIGAPSITFATEALPALDHA